MTNRTKVTTVDLWTERVANHEDCIFGAFTDGWGEGIPFDSIKVVKNCNCIISSNVDGIKAENKNHAVVFYRQGKVARLMVCERDTDIEKYVKRSLRIEINGKKICAMVSVRLVDMGEKPIITEIDAEQNPDIGSCDRLPLFNCMIAGSYTEEQSEYGQNPPCEYMYSPEATMRYQLVTDSEEFDICHTGLLVGEDENQMQKIIAVQNESNITQEYIESKFPRNKQKF